MRDVIFSTGFVTAIITLILGLFKWKLSKAKFEHDKELSDLRFNHNKDLAIMEHQNKWRNEYLSKTLNSEIDLSIRLQYLRFLQNTSQNDPAIAKWAEFELDLFSKAQEYLIAYLEKNAELTDLRRSISKISDYQLKKQQEDNINI